MSQRTRVHAASLIVALSVAPLLAHATGDVAQPAAFDGRYYEVVFAKGVRWEDAKAAAEAREHLGVKGQLATIGSAAEDSFVDQLRRQVLHSAQAPAGARTAFWVGGYQLPCVTANPEPACGWLWLNGEAIGAENGDDPYTNWLDGEPNNTLRSPSSTTYASEDYLTVGHLDEMAWNDEGSLSNLGGYIVEYGDAITIPAESCSFTGTGCNPTGAQLQVFPSSAKIEPGATLTARSWRFTDDPARCGVSPLVLFDGAVTIPPYLCGHPDFIVIHTETSGVTVATGTIDVENLTEDVLPDNLYGCTDVRQNPAGLVDPDPSHRDVVAWQATDPSKMHESALGSGRYYGSVAELTYGCGSSRGKIVASSYHFVGLRIHPGAGNEYTTNPRGNLQSFTDLADYKLRVLDTTVTASKPAVSKLSFIALKALVEVTRELHKRGQYRAALATTRAFVYAAERTKYQPTPGVNHSGETLMRAQNLEYLYAKKITPYSKN